MRPIHRVLRGLIFLPVALGCGSEAVDPTEFQAAAAPASAPREACANQEPLGRALFGDLHVHTSLSTDAWNYDLEVRPHGAYDYAFGGEIELPRADGTTVKTRIDRPLDFMAVTDHSEFMGEQRLCADTESGVYSSETCEGIRESTTPINNPLAFKIMNPSPGRESDVCGEDGERCATAALEAWHEVIAAAEAWNDTTAACERTAFIAYEYSSFRLGSNLHRNVIFAGSSVPKRPVSYMDVQREWELWQLLQEGCNESGTGCEVLAIPHNSNISNGRMFKTDYPGADGVEEEKARATLQASIEPLFEVMQHKGDSECRRGIPNILGTDDELCDFEKMDRLVPEQLGDVCSEGRLADSIPHLGPSCLSHKSYARYALIEGLKEEKRIGVNPFKFGLMASTDTHNAMGGGVRERDWPGHLGKQDGDLDKRLGTEAGVMGNAANGPGGIIGVYAEENSRASIFAAMKRKEVFGTSGPRIRPRFYAGWELPEGLCASPDLLAKADASGVPMGSDLPTRADREAPRFVLFAERDMGTAEVPGDLLQRLQIIKGWVDEEGGIHQEVVDVAGGENGAAVDTATCQVSGPGHDFLCGEWTDPDFDAAKRAVYYARAVENPTCRYSTWQCNAIEGPDRPSHCDDPRMGETQQERAWTSPIWYTP
jgi:hypothetical protein